MTRTILLYLLPMMSCSHVTPDPLSVFRLLLEPCMSGLLFIVDITHCLLHVQMMLCSLMPTT